MRPLPILLSVLLPGVVLASTPHLTPLPYRSSDASVGAANCGSALCHGAVRPVTDSNVLQSEYVIWTRRDKHARAYAVLFNERSAKIARNLGIGNPHEEKICVDCHAHNPPPALRGERFRVDDGVSCEGCHGPAQRWLPVHVERGATHARNVTHGLYPTDDAVARARLCLSCHLGNADRLVTHRLMGAGHPRMSFELETFTAIAPAHFSTDDDYQRRKRLWDGVQVWAVGQAVAVEQAMELLADPKTGRSGLFPELVLFDCHACHRSMKSGRWAPRVGGPGVPRLNDAHLLMVRQVAKVAAPELTAPLAAATAELHRSVAGTGGDTASAIETMRQLMGELLARIERHPFTAADLRRLLQGLIEDGRAGQYRDYAAAEQATLAIGSLANFMFRRGLVPSAVPANRALARLQATVADDEAYRPEVFAKALEEVEVLLRTLPRAKEFAP
jgi:hypothetical protein